jgi:hypothetical protein
VFDPVPPGKTLAKKTKAVAVRTKVPVMSRPGSLDELAYAPVTQLSEMVRSRKVKPSELTDMYLARLKRYDPQLHFVINLTEERARKQAKDMDAEISRGICSRSKVIPRRGARASTRIKRSTTTQPS